MMAPSVDQVQPLKDAVLAGQRTAVGKALSLVEGDSDAALRLCRDLRDHTGQATLIGLTGPPGCGKSSLISTIIAQLREQRCTVAVAAVDPSSRISGGAILGDRLRMAQHARDEGVFIRSLSSQGHLGGLTLQIHRSIDVLDAAGFDWIIVETVGTGQNEQEIAEITDAQIVVGNPTEEIVKIGNDYSVIAVSDSGKNWLKRLIEGSVAFDVMRTAETSVLNIR